MPPFDIKWKSGSMVKIDGLVDCDRADRYDEGFPSREESGKVGV